MDSLPWESELPAGATRAREARGIDEHSLCTASEGSRAVTRRLTILIERETGWFRTYDPFP